ncbi:MAG: hypothetical protein HDS68_06090 [Bacteroidales bacterium]|nr:hypothetical protein [Bacteroidales bacterium]
MKQRDLILGLGFLSAFSMAASSPYQGSTLPTEGSADFYLYQVETGQWIQNNYLEGYWTTRAALGKTGFDVAVIPVDGGYQLDAKLNGNGSINGDNLYMDTGDAKTVWSIEPVSVDGVTNAYKIVALSGPREGYPHTLGADADGVISNNAEENTTWQFVTREERIAKLKADLANGPVDASWLVPAQDFSRNDKRQNEWTIQYTQGQVCGNDGSMWNAVRETWNDFRNYAHYITVTDLPNGTYKLTMQGFYHENRDLDETWQKFLDGTDPKNGKYFAGASTGDFMNVAAQHVDDDMRNGLSGRWPQPAMLDGEYIPDGCEAVSLGVDRGWYQNPELTAVVKDGRLVLGVIKLDGSENDWMCYDNVKLTYVSTDTPDVDVTPLVEDLNAIMLSMEDLPTTSASLAAIEEGREALLSSDATDLRLSYLKLLKLSSAIKQSASTLTYYNLIRPMAVAEGADVSRADSDLDKAESASNFNEALKQLRWARRRAHAERSELEYKGSEAEPGKYYLYNVGQKQFLAPGSDWGAHAALGFPGLEVTLEPNYEGENDGTFHIDTQCYNGDEKHYMNYRGYLDCAKAGAWKFIPVEGKENVYTIEQNDYPGVVVAYNIDASTDDDNNRDETTVGCENRNFQGPDEDAQWMLITRAEREKMLENATLENPVDATFYIQNPNFCQREAIEEWSLQNGTVARRGERFAEFVIESWNTAECDLGTSVMDLPAGVYRLSANAFYRNGDHQSSYYDENDEEHPGEIRLYGQPDTEAISHAYLYAGDMDNDVLIPNILEGDGVAPGEGGNAKAADGTIYHYPQQVWHANNFFRLGAYKVSTVFESDGTDVPIGIYKDTQDYENDWVVADNFRLLYFGNNTTKDEVNAGIEEVTVAPAEVKGDDRIFNLQGIQVTNTNTPGIYIQNGKKFVVK